MTVRAHAALIGYDPTTNTVLTSSTANVYNPGTVTPISATIFDKNGNPLSNPLTGDASTGLIDFYLTVAQEVDIVVSKGGFTTRTYSNVPVLDDASNNLTALLTTTGDLPYASSANTPARLAIGSTGQLMTVTAGVPAWASTIAGAITFSNGLTVSSGIATFTGSLSSGGGTVAAGGVIRLANNSTINFRNAGNSADDSITMDSGDRFAVTGAAVLTTGGSVVNDWNVVINGTSYRVALKQ